MNGFDLWPILLPVAGLSLCLLAWWLYRMGREVQAERARESFRLQKERLEGFVLKAAAATGKPRGLRWVSCRFTDDFTLARDRVTRRLVALIPVTVLFDPVPGGDMEGIAAATEPRQATAVLHFRKGQWVSDGQTLFNVTPADALRLHQRQYAAGRAGGLKAGLPTPASLSRSQPGPRSPSSHKSSEYPLRNTSRSPRIRSRSCSGPAHRRSIALILPTLALAADWSQFRGPNGSGHHHHR